MASPKFAVGSAVFVKMRGYPAWPAKVEGIADETPNKVRYHIFFYGTKQIAVCKEEDMCCYLKCRELLGKPKKAKGFNEGILHMDKELGLVSNSKDTEDIQKSDDINKTYEGITENDTSLEVKKHDSHEELLSMLQLESQLVKINYGIQNSLSLKEADPEACLTLLKDLSNFNFNKLMLKKHPEIVYTLIQLQKYVGNTNNWVMTEEDIQVFNSKAQQIQEDAKLICAKFHKIFQVPDGSSFIDYFEREIVKFKECTKDLSLEDFFRLTKDPSNI